MANIRIRQRAAERGVKLWQIAYKLGMTDGNFSRKLRTELSADEQKHICEIIDELAKEGEE